MTITPEKCVKDTLADLGKTEETDGYWTHKL